MGNCAVSAGYAARSRPESAPARERFRRSWRARTRRRRRQAAARRRGYARAVVSAATRASLEARNEITFLVADDEDWPKDLYASLGYEPIGRRFEFTRL